MFCIQSLSNLCHLHSWCKKRDHPKKTLPIANYTRDTGNVPSNLHHFHEAFPSRLILRGAGPFNLLFNGDFAFAALLLVQLLRAHLLLRSPSLAGGACSEQAKKGRQAAAFWGQRGGRCEDQGGPRDGTDFRFWSPLPFSSSAPAKKVAQQGWRGPMGSREVQS